MTRSGIVGHGNIRRINVSLRIRLPQKVYVIGLGQMGGSWVLASRKNKIFTSIAGWDIRDEVRRKAAAELRLKLMDFDEGIRYAEMVVLAVPVPTILTYLARISRLSHRSIILDFGSTKAQIMKLVEKQYPDLHFVGGHPFAGTEKSRETGWDERNFEERTFFLCRSNNSSSALDTKLVRSILVKLGANLVEMDPVVHDRILAFTSHLPYCAAAMVVKTHMQSSFSSNPVYLGPGFESTTRLALSSTEMIEGIVRTNRENILNALRAFEKSLREFRSLIYLKDWQRLRLSLREIQTHRQRSLHG